MSDNAIRSENLSALRRLMASVPLDWTRPALAKALGLSIVTVNALIRVLEERGEVLARPDKATGNGGRPVTLYVYNFDAVRALSVSVWHENGAERVYAAVRDLRREILWQRDTCVPVNDEGFLDGIIEAALSAVGGVKAIAVGLSGEEVDGVMSVSDYTCLCGRSVSRHIRERFGLPVFVENDVKAAMIGRSYADPDLREETAATLFIPETDHGPGAAILERGRILRGRNGMCGEVCMLPLGIDWASPMSDAEFFDALKKVCLCLVALSNPHRLILYGNRITPDAADALREAIEGVNPALLPDRIELRDFIEDITLGTERLAFAEILPELAV